MKLWKLLLALIVFSNLYLTASAQSGDATPIPTPSADDVNNIAKNMYCPVCENTPLDTCETLACQDWREEIRLRLSEGWGEQAIYDYFVEQHGDRVLALPPARGINLLVYIVPPLAILAGIVIVGRIMRGAIVSSDDSTKKSENEGLDVLDDEDYISQIEQQLIDRE